MGCGFSGDANYYSIAGTGGSILSPMAVAGRMTERELHIHIFAGDEKRVERFRPENPYAAELDYFAECVQNGTRPFPGLENSLENIAMIEEVFRAAG
jgi:predicted dehydrogenase